MFDGFKIWYLRYLLNSKSNKEFVVYLVSTHYNCGCFNIEVVVSLYSKSCKISFRINLRFVLGKLWITNPTFFLQPRAVSNAPIVSLADARSGPFVNLSPPAPPHQPAQPPQHPRPPATKETRASDETEAMSIYVLLVTSVSFIRFFLFAREN